MIRILTSIILYIFSIIALFAQVSSEEVLLKNGEIQLPGTLTYTAKGTPLIIWVHGSGNVDRNGNQVPQVKANYIKQFRDAMNKNGIAFFSYDKRTANKDNFKLLKDMRFAHLVEDAQIAVAHFKNDKRFSEIIIAGHSQGSLVAMLASKGCTKYISLAGTARTIDHILTEQISKQSPMLGAVTKLHLKELKETGKIAEVNPMLMRIFAPQNQAFLASWILYDPSAEIKRINIPILIVNGTKDIQVPTTEAEALHKANPNSKLVLIQQMNHVLKQIDKDEDNMKSYFSANYPLSQQLTQTIVNFIKK